MNGLIKCRHISPRLLDRLKVWLGFSSELHSWLPYRRQNRRFLWFCRKCECGAHQVQRAGIMGDCKWHDVDLPFTFQWEREEFDAAEILDTYGNEN